MKIRFFSVLALMVIFSLLIPGPAVSESASPTGQNRPMEEARSDLLLYKGVNDVGLSAGPGWGVAMFGSNNEHDIFMGYAHWGWVFTEMLAEDKWNRGNWEFLLEGFGGTQYEPGDFYIAGISGLFRYNFMPEAGNWIPFLDIGGGLSLTDIGEPDLGGEFQFNLQGDAGVHYFFSPKAAFTLKAKLFHLSNAGTDTPNTGMNTLSVVAGFSWFF